MFVTYIKSSAAIILELVSRYLGILVFFIRYFSKNVSWCVNRPQQTDSLAIGAKLKSYGETGIARNRYQTDFISEGRY